MADARSLTLAERVCCIAAPPLPRHFTRRTAVAHGAVAVALSFLVLALPLPVPFGAPPLQFWGTLALIALFAVFASLLVRALFPGRAMRNI